MSEDEADMLIANRRAKEPTIDFQDYLRKHVYPIKTTPGLNYSTLRPDRS